MKSFKIKISFFLFFFSISLISYPQAYTQVFSKKYRYHSIGANLNAMNYVGELDPGPSIISPSLSLTKYNIGFAYMYKYTAHLTLRANVSYGRIKGSDYQSAGYNIEDIHRKMRNLNFRNQIYELKLDAVIDFIGNYRHFRRRPTVVPYASFGIAYFYHNPQGQTPDGDWVNLKPLSTEGQGISGSGKKPYSLHQIAIPVGLGIRYKLGRYWDFGFEIGWRYTFTDYLDDVGGTYADKDLLLQEKGELAASMSDRTMEAIKKDPKLKDFVENRQGGYVNKDNNPYNGNGDTYVYSYNIPGAQRGDPNKDWYIVTGFHLIYIFPPRVICPKFRR